MNKKVGLVLEGGGFRGIYSAGIIDFLLEKNIELPYVIGVSMGACNGVNYISKQIGRNLNIPYSYVNDKRYMSYSRLFTKGELFGMDFIFNEIPKKIIPFDFETYSKSAQDFVIGTTDCITGKPFYIKTSDYDNLLTSLKASASLPFASKMVNFNDKKLLDGGISDPIPFKKAFKDGCDKVLIVLTQPIEFEKKPTKFSTIGKLMYRKYPQLLNVLSNRYNFYNQQLEDIKQLEKEGKAYVIRPVNKIPVSRTERNKEKLKEAFNMGYIHCEKIFNDLNNWLNS